MNKLFITIQKQSFLIGLIIILALFRIIPHPPNFTPIIAVAIMSTYFFRNLYTSLGVILISMLISDLLIGFYNNIIFVYLSLFLLTLAFYKFSTKINIKNLFMFGFIGSLIFFIISNFGVWITSELYSKDAKGLIECYYLAIPFFRNTLFSTILFSYLGMLTALTVSQINFKTE